MPFGESKACGGEGSLSQKIPLVKLPELTKKVKKVLTKRRSGAIIKTQRERETDPLSAR